MLKKMAIAATFTTMLVAPALAQSYSAAYGTGNVINLPLAERTNGAAGVGVGAYNGAGVGASAYNGNRVRAHRSSGMSAFADASRRQGGPVVEPGQRDSSILSQH